MQVVPEYNQLKNVMSYLDEISDRINQVVDHFTLKDDKQNVSAFSKMIDFRPDTISTYIGKKGKISMPGAEFISLLVGKLGICSEWMLLGKGEMFRTNETEKLKVTDGNKYLVDRFEEVISELSDIKREVIKKDERISQLMEHIAELEKEKKENNTTIYADEPQSKLKTKNKHKYTEK